MASPLELPDSVLVALDHDLRIIGKRDQALATGARAATARKLAAAMDAGGSNTSLSMCANSLVALLSEIAALAPEAEAHDDVDRLKLIV